MTGLSAIFLGHQGWLLGSGSTHILVDPLLTETFGHGGLAGQVFPPRSIDRSKLPPIDAVVLTHEHDDHFDIPTLLAVERTIPVYISGRSSPALGDFLRARGFDVRPMDPGETKDIGTLRYRTFVADHRGRASADEWDVLPFIVSDGEGAFVSSVDVPMPPETLAALADTQGWPGVLCLANNTTDTRFVKRGVGRLQPSDDTDVLARVLQRRWLDLAGRVGAPRVTVITGAGWSHTDSWVDVAAFSIDPSRLAEQLQARCDAPVRVARPGVGVRLQGADAEPLTSPAVVCEHATRPAASSVEVPERFAPVSPTAALDSEDWARLEDGLASLARYWHGRTPFLEAMSSPHSASIAFALHDPALPWETPRVYAYAPTQSTFLPWSADDPFTHVPSGLECWASDLLALFEGRLGPSALCYSGRIRCWNQAPQRIRVSPHTLWTFAHPLHRADVARRLYEHVADGLGPVEIDIRGPA